MDPIKAIEDALAAGPTPGPWRASPSVWIGATAILRDDGVFSVEDVATETVICDRRTPWPECATTMLANAALIAACHPEAIRSLIARLREAEADAQVQRNRCTVLARWIAEAVPTLEIADDLIESEDGGSYARMLIDSGKSLVKAVLPIPAAMEETP